MATDTRHERAVLPPVAGRRLVAAAADVEPSSSSPGMARSAPACAVARGVTLAPDAAAVRVVLADVWGAWVVDDDGEIVRVPNTDGGAPPAAPDAAVDLVAALGGL